MHQKKDKCLVVKRESYKEWGRGGGEGERLR